MSRSATVVALALSAIMSILWGTPAFTAVNAFNLAPSLPSLSRTFFGWMSCQLSEKSVISVRDFRA